MGPFSLAVAAALLAWPAPGLALRNVDREFAPVVTRPAFASDQGPVLVLDAAHHNMHQADGLYAPFADLLRRDGFRVQSGTSPWTPETLQGVHALVVVNALHVSNVDRWALPSPSAFTPAEMDALRHWLSAGGALWLVADHMPFAGAATDLAASLGVQFANCYAFASSDGRPTLDDFIRSNDTLRDHVITRGRLSGESITKVITFTGSAFQVRPDIGFEPLLVLGPEATMVLPQDSQQFLPTLPRYSAAGWYQGGVFRYGRGRVAVFGEAAMFSAQLQGLMKRKMGMNHPRARQNAQFALNIARWLVGTLEAPNGSASLAQ